MDARQYMLFSKHLAELPLAEAAKRVRAIGLSAIDLTVRPGGHVEPERVEDELPEAVRVLAAAGLRVGMISTGLGAPSRTAERVLRSAVSCGIPFYKLGYVRYPEFGSLAALRRDVKSQLRELAAMNRSIGIAGGFHNHSNDFFGASLWDIDHVLDGIEPTDIGVYFDPAHAAIEGGSAGWLMGLDLILPRVTMLAVKDFRWVDGKHRYSAGRSQSVEFCPLADGNTPWPRVIEILTAAGFAGPVSFHSEYQGSHSFADLSTEHVIQQTAKDVAVFSEWCAAAAKQSA